ncbi:class I SAM-dependent methyltransferase [Pseudorhodoferax sp. Leaf267]|uniref:class I SAM-dependent methyltransferase n=1 Tax=Pseudorhodoferax sp. Leaf267 TaxID=1736316 RepID=UPI0006F6478D|nr:class I SAM-dependent methyltransferase [Pseudorhodoferax sp. Leaf267]KQP18333.1 hypothetical protein ASF43_10985 [Pseudorhodoferax sp. Leaf267]
MTGFSTDWLALREPFDHAARTAAAAALDWPALAAHLPAGGEPTTVLDLGCGTGATLRALAPRLGSRQRWTLVDHDARLLDAMPAALAPWSACQGLHLKERGGVLLLQGGGRRIEIERRRADLVAGFDQLRFESAQLVTASALLDLVSAPWLAALVARCRAANAAICWALNVDDRMDWQPVDPSDVPVHALFQAHQQRNKGFGPALGGAAVTQAGALLVQAGYRVSRAASDWLVDGMRGAQDRAMLRAMVEGVALAALEQQPASHAEVDDWKARRLGLVADTCLRVGHVDVLGIPAAPR